MECRHVMNSVGGMEILCFDCLGCENQGIIVNKKCLAQVLNAIVGIGGKVGVDELQFRGREYVICYDKKDTEKLVEIAQIRKDMCEERVWEQARDCSRSHKDRRMFIKNILRVEVFCDPLKAHGMVCAVLNQYERGYSKSRCMPECRRNYIRILGNIKDNLRETKLVDGHCKGQSMFDMLKQRKQPSFITSQLRHNLPKNSRLVSSYRTVDSGIGIYDISGVDKLYFIDPPELSLSNKEVCMLVKLKEEVIKKHIMEVIQPSEAREYFKRLSLDLMKENGTMQLPKRKLEKLSDIFARYTAGFGLLEVLFNDKHIYDIYVDSPAGTTPVYVEHSIFGLCNTNLYLGEDDLERISSKFRSIGGRPFDEANPIMDMQLKDLGIRVAGIREPATFDGIAYSFRKRKETPWTLAKFVDEGMMSPKSAALLGMIVNGQRSILVTGARGSGKTSLLSALITQIRQNNRIVLMEDTSEIPSKNLRELGWRIEHLRNRSVVSRNREGSYELSPEENLRAALRLGEGVLILGEVRGPEARALFEAMRVGAAGSTVLGTIHGSSPHDTWDRITNDLNVPATSFKAVDVVVSLGYLEDHELTTRKRYISAITEVRKNWKTNPADEGGFVDMMIYDNIEKKEFFNLENSEVMGDIAIRKMMYQGEWKNDLDLRRRIIKTLVEIARKKDLKELLEVHHILNSEREYVRLINQQSLNQGSIDYSRIYREWRRWLKKYVINM